MDNQEIIMIKIIMIREIIKIDIDQIGEIERHHLEVEVNMDRIIGKDHLMSLITEITLEDNFRDMQNDRGQNFRGRYRRNYRNDNFGRGRNRSREGNIQVILAGMMEVVVVGQDQVQELVLIETGLDALNVGNMIISLKTVQIH